MKEKLGFPASSYSTVALSCGDVVMMLYMYKV